MLQTGLTFCDELFLYQHYCVRVCYNRYALSVAPLPLQRLVSKVVSNGGIGHRR